MRILINNAERLVLIAIISLLLTVTGGSSLTFAEEEPDLEVPFLGVTIGVVEAPTVSLSLIKEIRQVSATYEHHIVATALQAMRVTEGVKAVPEVMVATDDMGSFPSPEQSLYPDYLAKRFSQFRYTVDSNGIVSVDAFFADTEAQLVMVEQWLDRLEEDK